MPGTHHQKGDTLTTPDLPNHQPATEASEPTPAAAQAPTPETATTPTTETAAAPVGHQPVTASTETPNVPAQPARKPLNKTLLIGAASFVIGALLGIAGTAATINTINDSNAKAAAEAAAKAEADKPHVLKAAATKCGITTKTGASLGDNDTSLALDGKGDEDSYGLSMTDITCVMDAIKVPDYIRAEMNKTRALDGTQRESWGNINATWSYHPNTGFNLGLSEKQ